MIILPATRLRPEASHWGFPLLRHLPALRPETGWDKVSPGYSCIVREPASPAEAPVLYQPPAALGSSAGVGRIALVPQVSPPSDTGCIQAAGID